MNFRALFIATALVANLPGVAAQAQNISTSELADYYAKIPGQYIVPNASSFTAASTAEFSLHQDAYTPLGDQMFDLEFSQDLFKTDVAQFNKAMGASNFLDAKIKFYSKLNFDDRWQKHERPYHYMAGWLSLNHPPIKAIELPLGAYNNAFSDANPRPTSSMYYSPEFQARIDGESGTELTFGNNLKPLFNDNSIKEKIRLVNDAKRYVFGAVMATFCDSSSEDFVQALINKAKSGVPVTLMMEGFYMGLFVRKCTDRLRDGGVDVLLVDDKAKLKTLLSFFHAKFWIRDGEEVIVGGQNIVKFENYSTGYNQLNRDSDLLMQGPGAIDFVGEYIKIWEQHQLKRNESLEAYKKEVEDTKAAQRIAGVRGIQAYADKLNNPATRMKGVCRSMVQEPYNKNLSIAHVLRDYIDQAQHSIVITSPEIEFDMKKSKPTEQDELYQATRDAATRGVDMELILNGVDGGNGEITAEFHELFERFFESGRKLLAAIFLHELNHEPQNNAREHRKYLLDLEKTPNYHTWTHFNYMHAKQGLFDRIATSITSFNLDKASMERNYEAGAICLDDGLEQAMEQQLTMDLANSTPVVSLHENTSAETAQNSPNQE